MRHVRQGDLGRVEVLEGDVNLGRGADFEDFSVLVSMPLPGGVGVEREGLAVQVHVLQLGLVVPRRVLDRQVHVGRVGTRRVGEDARRGVADGQAELLGLLQRRACARSSSRRRLVLLGGELDGAVQQVHLVDEQISEDAGAVDDDVNSRSAEFFQRNQSPIC